MTALLCANSHSTQPAVVEFFRSWNGFVKTENSRVCSSTLSRCYIKSGIDTKLWFNRVLVTHPLTISFAAVQAQNDLFHVCKRKAKTPVALYIDASLWHDNSTNYPLFKPYWFLLTKKCSFFQFDRLIGWRINSPQARRIISRQWCRVVAWVCLIHAPKPLLAIRVIVVWFARANIAVVPARRASTTIAGSPEAPTWCGWLVWQPAALPCRRWIDAMRQRRRIRLPIPPAVTRCLG